MHGNETKGTPLAAGAGKRRGVVPRLVVYVLLVVPSCLSKRSFNPDSQGSPSRPTVVGVPGVRRPLVTPADRLRYRALASIFIGPEACTATHVGRGVLMTARHCVLVPRLTAPQANLDLAVYDNEFNQLIDAEPGHFLDLAPKVTGTRLVETEDGRQIQLPLPDIVFLIPERALARRVAARLGTARVSQSPLALTSTGLLLVGFGRADFATTPRVAGDFNEGDIALSDVSAERYQSSYDGGRTVSSGGGDSGAPLLRFESASLPAAAANDASSTLPLSTPVVYGVTSHVEILDRRPDGTPSRTRSTYERVDLAGVASTLAKALDTARTGFVVPRSAR